MLHKWRCGALVLAILGGILTGTVALGAQSDSATPNPAGQATPEAGSGVPVLAFSPTNSERGYFEHTLEPGAIETISVRIANLGPESYRLATYPSDVYTRLNGGFEARLSGEPISGATHWLDYPAETFDMQPGQEITRDFTVAVPAGTPPGEYTTSIVIQNADPIGGEAGGGFGVLQVFRQVVAVAITVPGPREPGLAVNAATYRVVPAYASVMVTVENSGNIRLSPIATMVLTAADGAEVTSATLQMDTFLPGTETDLEFQLVGTLDLGDYQVEVSLEDEANQVTVGPEILTMTIAAPEGTPVAETNINIAAVEITEARDAAGALQVVEAIVRIDNPGMQVANARVTLHVTRDGDPVEDLVLGSSLTFPSGPAEFQQRYLPMEGWTPSVYTFSVTLDSIDPNNDQPVILDTAEAPVAVTVE